MHKTLFLIAVSAGLGIVCAQTATTAATPKVASAKTKKVAKPKAGTPVTTKAIAAKHPIEPLKIPVGAVRTAEGNYRFADNQGKVWLYRDTPFGVSRIQENPVAAASAVATSTPAVDPNERVTAVAQGDTIHFQKPSPFGITSWQKNKADLTPEEQKVWEREQGKRNR